MGKSLDGYVAQRVPTESLKLAIQRGWTIEVHGIPAEVLLANLELVFQEVIYFYTSPIHAH